MRASLTALVRTTCARPLSSQHTRPRSPCSHHTRPPRPHVLVAVRGFAGAPLDRAAIPTEKKKLEEENELEDKMLAMDEEKPERKEKNELKEEKKKLQEHKEELMKEWGF